MAKQQTRSKIPNLDASFTGDVSKAFGAEARSFRPSLKHGKKNALGRGLAALMNPTEVSVAQEEKEVLREQAAAPTPVVQIQEIREANRALEQENPRPEGLDYVPLQLIVRNEKQPRQHFPIEEIQTLAESIKQTGLLQPIIIRKKESADENGAIYEIVAGERRFRASKLAGLTSIPAIIRELDDKETLELGIIENVQRADLNPIEEAQAYKRLIEEYGASQEDVAKVVARDRASVANAMRLLKLPPVVRTQLAERRISAGHGRALLMLERPQEQIVLAHRIVEEGLSVRAVEKLIADNRADTPASKPQTTSGAVAVSLKTPRVLELEERIRRVLGTKVDLKLDKKGRGELKISFFSQDEFESILEQLGA